MKIGWYGHFLLSPSGASPERGEGWGEGQTLARVDVAPHPNPLPIRTTGAMGRGDGTVDSFFFAILI